MSAISLKSITGITSITTPAGVDNQLTLHTNNTTERVKIDVAGNVHVNNHLNITGVTTVSDNIEVVDSKHVYWGTGKDLSITHNGTHGFLHAINGGFYMKVGNGEFLNRNGTQVIAKFLQGTGGVELYHNNVKKTYTSNNGFYITDTGRAAMARVIAPAGYDARIDLTADTHGNEDNYRIEVNTDQKFRVYGKPGGNYTSFIELDQFGRVTLTRDVDVARHLDVDGHTNLDNVSIAGITTFASNVGIAQSIFHNGDTNTTIGFSGNDQIKIHTGGEERFFITSSYNWLKNYTSVNTTISADTPTFHVRNNTQSYHTIWESQNTNARSTIFQWNDYGNSGTAGNLIFRSRNSPYEEHARFTGAGNFNLLKDLDVDGHTNLDNATIAGITTFTNVVTKFKANNGGNTHLQILSTGSGEAGIFFDAANGDISGSDYAFIGQQNNLDFVIKANPNAGNIDFQRGTDTKVRIDTSGRLLVNTTTTYSSNQMMIVKGASPTSGGNRPYDGQLAIESTETSGAINTGGVLAFIGHDGGTARGFGSIRNLKEDGTSGNYGTYMSFETRTNGSAPAEKLRITSTGQVKITGVDDQDNLVVNGGSSQFAVHQDDTDGEVSLRAQDASGNNYTKYMTFFTENGSGPTERLRIDSSGNMNLGLGATIAGLRYLDVQNSSSASNNHGSILRLITSNAAGNSTTSVDMVKYKDGNFYINNNETSGSTNFNTGGSTRLVITSGGQLLLNETSAFDSNTGIQFRYDNSGNTADFVFRNRANNSNSRVNLKLSTLNRAANADVSSGIEKYQNGGMAIYNGENTNQYSNINFFTNGWRSLQLRNGNHSGAWCAEIDAYWGTSNGLRMEVGGPQSGTWQAIDFHTSHTGTQRGYIGVTYGGVSYNSSSDYRMKQDVVDMTGAIERIKLFLPKRFKWKEDPTHTVDGFLAHEAATVVPESVQGEKDGEQMQVMDNSKLVPVLTAALKEAIAKIEILETKVAALEGS